MKLILALTLSALTTTARAQGNWQPYMDQANQQMPYQQYKQCAVLYATVY